MAQKRAPYVPLISKLTSKSAPQNSRHRLIKLHRIILKCIYTPEIIPQAELIAGRVALDGGKMIMSWRSRKVDHHVSTRFSTLSARHLLCVGAQREREPTGMSLMYTLFETQKPPRYLL